MVELFQSGGTFMYPILFVFCLGIAIILERLFFLYYKYNINAQKLYEQIRRTALQGDIKRAVGFCDDSPLAAVLKAGLQQYQVNQKEVPAAMEEAILEVAPRVQRRTHYLAVIANIAVLLGLLGTIAGLIVAFSAISGSEPGEKAVQLARGISIAMNTTAFGLVVAIPCMLFHAILQSKANKLLDEIDQYSTKTAHLLHAQGGPGRDPQ
jgi:biopolymer transport protein ExbB/TolQ